MRLVGAVAVVASILVSALTVGLHVLRTRQHRVLRIDAPAFRVPPGWYPDPTVAAGQRWWDGMTWTDQATDQA